MVEKRVGRKSYCLMQIVLDLLEILLDLTLANILGVDCCWVVCLSCSSIVSIFSKFLMCHRNTLREYQMR